MFNFECLSAAERMGYNGILKALKDLDNPENEKLLEWVGGEFDPEWFSLEEVNGRLG